MAATETTEGAFRSEEREGGAPITIATAKREAWVRVLSALAPFAGVGRYSAIPVLGTVRVEASGDCVSQIRFSCYDGAAEAVWNGYREGDPLFGEGIILHVRHADLLRYAKALPAKCSAELILSPDGKTVTLRQVGSIGGATLPTIDASANASFVYSPPDSDAWEGGLRATLADATFGRLVELAKCSSPASNSAVPESLQYIYLESAHIPQAPGDNPADALTQHTEGLEARAFGLEAGVWSTLQYSPLTLRDAAAIEGREARIPDELIARIAKAYRAAYIKPTKANPRHSPYLSLSTTPLAPAEEKYGKPRSVQHLFASVGPDHDLTIRARIETNAKTPNLDAAIRKASPRPDGTGEHQKPVTVESADELRDALTNLSALFAKRDVPKVYFSTQEGSRALRLSAVTSGYVVRPSDTATTVLGWYDLTLSSPATFSGFSALNADLALGVLRNLPAGEVALSLPKVDHNGDQHVACHVATPDRATCGIIMPMHTMPHERDALGLSLPPAPAEEE